MGRDRYLEKLVDLGNRRWTGSSCQMGEMTEVVKAQDAIDHGSGDLAKGTAEMTPKWRKRLDVLNLQCH